VSFSKIPRSRALSLISLSMLAPGLHEFKIDIAMPHALTTIFIRTEIS